MIEKTFKISAPDGAVIPGILNSAGDKPAEKLIIIAPGFACDLQDPLYEKAQHYFTQQGYDVARFGFCGEGPGERVLRDSSLVTQVNDMLSVVAHFSPQYKTMHLAGHSFGGLTALLVCPKNISAISFWDTTLCPDTGFTAAEAVFDPSLQAFRYKDFIIGQNMVTQANSLTPETLDHLATRLIMPVQFLFAEDGTARSHEESFFAAVPGIKEKTEIAGADHFFTTGDTAFQLLTQTLSWFQKHEAPAAGTAPSFGALPDKKIFP